MKHFLGIPLPSFNATTVAPTPSTMLLDIARPISDASPTGRDVSYEPDFLRLKEEVDKINAIDMRVDQERATDLTRQLKNVRGRSGSQDAGATNGSAAAIGFDADLVVSLAHSILRDHSKDLRVVAYLALGLARRDGLRGVAEGIQAIESVARLYWDAAFPPPARVAGRMNAIDTGLGWLRETVDREQPVGTDREGLEAALRSVTSLRELATGWKHERVVQRVSGLATSLSDAIAKLPAELAAVSRPSRGRAKTNGVTGRSLAALGMTNVGHHERSEGSAFAPATERVVETEATTAPAVSGVDPVIDRAVRLLKEDSTRPLPYRLVRVYRWDALLQEPRNTHKRTLIEPPPARRREYLARLHAEQQWLELVLQGEESFGQNPFHFWLDLQRLTLDALSALGPAYAAAREAASGEVQRLVARIPALTTMMFADGMRFASPSVVTWLEELAASAPSAKTDAAVERRPHVDTGEQFADARKRFSDGDLNGALALLERGTAHDTSERQRFQRRMYMASLCLEAGQLAVARALLEELSHIVEAHGLARWEPELAVTVWTRQYACYAGLAGRLARGPDADQLARDMESVFARICRIDTSRALATAQEARRPP